MTATHPKPAYAQTRVLLLKPWSHAHDRGNCYKKVMAGRCSIATTKGICLLLVRKEQKILSDELNKGRSNAVI